MTMTHPNVYAKRALTQFAQVGATLPEPVAAAVATRRKVAEHTTAMQERKNTAGAALYEAIVNDTTDAPELVALATCHTLTQVLGVVEQTADNALTATLARHADEMVEALREVFDPLAATLARSHTVLGDMDIRTDHDRVLSMGSKAAAAWSQAYAADESIAAVVQAWRSLALAAQWRMETAVGLYGLVVWDAARWLDTPHEYRANVIGATPWDAVRKGWTLALPTRADLRQLDADVATEKQRREQRDARKWYSEPTLHGQPVKRATQEA